MMEFELVSTMPTYRDLFSHNGAIGRKAIIKLLKSIPLRDCIFTLSKLSRYYYKYIQRNYVPENLGSDEYKNLCLELFDRKTKVQLLKKSYGVIAPELSLLYLSKLALKYCDNSKYTTEPQFPAEILNKIGQCILITNSLLEDEQRKRAGRNLENEGELAVNLIKQLIADKNFDTDTEICKNYFLYSKFLKKYEDKIDIEAIFQNKFGLSTEEYFAFLFLIYGAFEIKYDGSEDANPPQLSLNNATERLLPQFKKERISQFILPESDYKKLDEEFFSLLDILRRPLVELKDGMVIPISLKRLFSSITEGVYHDILNSLPPDQQKKFSTYFGRAVEDYFVDLMQNVSKNSIPEFAYGKLNKRTPDTILPETDGLIFLECKKRLFHTQEFLRNGDSKMYLARIKEFCGDPLEQICDRISDFRKGEFHISGAKNDAVIYPVIVYPIIPPLLSGTWDSLKLSELISNDYLKKDVKVMKPEFLEFEELLCVEEWLRNNPSASFIDLIKEKQADEKYPNANWFVFLYKTGRSKPSKRLTDKFIKETKKFNKLLFDPAKRRVNVSKKP